MKRGASLLLAAALCAVLLDGCGPAAPPDGLRAVPEAGSAVSDELNPAGQYPIVREPITVSMMASRDATQPDDWNELLVFQRLEELTNVHFDFQIVDGDVFSTQMNVQLAGNSYADVLARGLTVDDENTYGPAGKFVELTDLIDAYMPNLKLLWEREPEVRAAMTTTDGKIYGLAYYFPSAANVPVTSFFSETWMKNAGVDRVPETTEELYRMLKAFKETDANGNGDPNDEIPFSYVGVGAFHLYIEPAITGYTGGCDSGGWDVDGDGKVVYIPALDTYRDYLEYCHRLYAEGLVDPEFVTQDMDQLRAKVKADLVGMYNMSPTIFNGTKVEARGENQICLPPLTSQTNSRKVLAAPQNIAVASAAITDKCRYPEAVARYFDLFYASEDRAVDNFCGKTLLLGYENEQWRYTDGTKTRYEFIPPITNSDDLNRSVTITMYLPGYADNSAMLVGNQYMEQKIGESRKKQAPYQRTAFPINARYTKEESEEISLAATDLNAYVTMMEEKFITGEEPLGQFERYRSELSGYRLNEIRKVKQAVYDRWVEASR